MNDTMPQSPVQANSRESPDFSRRLWKPNIHDYGRKSSPGISIMIYMNPLYTILSCFLKIHFYIILPSIPLSTAHFSYH